VSWSGRRGPRRLRLSTSVGRQVLHGSPVAVALPCRGLKPRAGIDGIILAVDAESLIDGIGYIDLHRTRPRHLNGQRSGRCRLRPAYTTGSVEVCCDPDGMAVRLHLTLL